MYTHAYVNTYLSPQDQGCVVSVSTCTAGPSSSWINSFWLQFCPPMACKDRHWLRVLLAERIEGWVAVQPPSLLLCWSLFYLCCVNIASSKMQIYKFYFENLLKLEAQRVCLTKWSWWSLLRKSFFTAEELAQFSVMSLLLGFSTLWSKKKK